MASNQLLDGLVRTIRGPATRAIKRALRSGFDDRELQEPRARFKPSGRPQPPSNRKGPKPKKQRRPNKQPEGTYPGDYTQMPEIVYDPHPDGLPDPGEIVWTWVPYEEDHSKGKDRPALLIGRDDEWLLGLQVTSQDNDRDAHEARAGRYWIDIGTGEWDAKRRPSDVRVNRIIRIDPDDVRRVGAILDDEVFTRVAAEVSKHY